MIEIAVESLPLTTAQSAILASTQAINMNVILPLKALVEKQNCGDNWGVDCVAMVAFVCFRCGGASECARFQKYDARFSHSIIAVDDRYIEDPGE